LKTTYVLIDYENVQPKSIPALDNENFRVIVFVGVNQAKVTFTVASVLQRMGSRAEYIQISGSGSNALDFHIAFYIGRLSAKDPDACFAIISKDTGFDPLIAHLKSMKIAAFRFKDFAEIAATKGAGSKLPDNKIAIIQSNLKQMGTSRPRTVKTLARTINALFQKKLQQAEIADLIEELRNQNAISVEGTGVVYALSE